MGQSLAIPRVIPEDWKRLDLIVNKIKMRLGRNASPTFAGVTITGCCVLGLNSAIFQPTTDSTTFFQVLDADGGTPILNVDTTNERVGFGTTTPLRKVDIYGGAFSVGGLNDGLFLSYGGSGGVIVGEDHAQNGYNDVAIRAGVDGTGIVIKTDGSFEIYGKMTAGTFAVPISISGYGIELHYSGDDASVTGIRSRARLKTTDTTASAQGALLQAANEDGIDAGVLNGALIEAIGKSDSTAATISMMRGCLVNTEWNAKDTVTDLRVLHVRTHTRDAATEGYVSGTGYGIYIENEAVGGNGQALDAGIYFKGTNLSAGNKAFTYGIDFSGATYGTTEIKLSSGGVVGQSGITITGTIKGTIFNATDEDNILQIDGTTIFKTGDTAWCNLFIGENAGATASSTSQNNMGIGEDTLSSLTTGDGNVAIGVNALELCADGLNNFGIGLNSLKKVSSANQNVGVGSGTGVEITTGSSNILIGTSAGAKIVGGSSNVLIGTSAGQRITGRENVGIGSNALKGIVGQSNGIKNIAIGLSAGLILTTGNSNIFIGNESGRRQTTNSNLLIIDNQDRASAAAELTNCLIYGVFDATVTTQSIRFNAGNLSLVSGTPYQYLINDTHEDTDGGRESRIDFKGEQTGGELTTLARIEVSHDGSADDQKGYLDIFINDGDDDDSPTKILKVDSSGINLSTISTLAAGINVLRVTGLQTDGTALTGTLRGGYIDVSNGALDATGTIRAMELKARTEAPGDTGNDVAVLEGLSISADSKGHGVTTMRAAEFILDGSAGGTIDEAVGLRIANNLQADKATTSYGLQIYRDSFDYTADIQLSDGSVINKSGYWGIGTSTPDSEIEIKGEVNGEISEYIKNTSTGAAAFSTLALYSDGGKCFLHTFGANYTTYPFLTYKAVLQDTPASAGLALIARNNTGIITFSIGGLGSGDEVLRMDSTGLGIGTTSPDTKLQVVGDCKLGDDNTNYIAFAADGTQTMTGTARVTKHSWIHAGGIRGPGTGGATEGLNDNGWLVLTFPDSGQKYGQANIKVPDDMDLSADSYLCVGWSSTAIINTCSWTIDYLLTALDNSTDDTPTGSTTAYPAPSGSTNGLVMSAIVTIAGGTITDEQCIHIKISRDPDDDALGADAEVHGAALQYTANKLGA